MDGLAVVLVIFNIIALLGVAIFVFMNSSSISEIQDELELEKEEEENENNNEAELLLDVKTLKSNRDTLLSNMENVKARIGPTTVTATPATTLTNDIAGVQTALDTHAALDASVAHAAAAVP